jgi:hypothetical protein
VDVVVDLVVDAVVFLDDATSVVHEHDSDYVSV